MTLTVSLPKMLFAALTLTALALGGCTAQVETGGADMKFLDRPPEREPLGSTEQPLLPLTVGNRWDMVSFTGGRKATGKMVVKGPMTVEGVRGMEVEIQKNGKPWRREAYRIVGNELQLLAAQDENADLMRYVPPIPLVRYPATEGDRLLWSGEFRLKKRRLPARALSRVSAREKLRTGAGIFETVRLETNIRVDNRSQILRFPVMRWMAPGVGIVRRAFYEKQSPSFAEVVRFHVQ